MRLRLAACSALSPAGSPRPRSRCSRPARPRPGRRRRSTPPTDPDRDAHRRARPGDEEGRARAARYSSAPPDLDVREGPARKLQYASTRLRARRLSLSPLYRAPSRLVRYIDARLPTGEDFDRASCIAALSRRRGSAIGARAHNAPKVTPGHVPSEIAEIPRNVSRSSLDSKRVKILGAIMISCLTSVCPE